MHGASAPVAATARTASRGSPGAKNAAEIPLDKIARDPDQPREEFDEESLARLAESLQATGPAPADPGPLGRGQGRST